MLLLTALLACYRPATPGSPITVAATPGPAPEIPDPAMVKPSSTSKPGFCAAYEQLLSVEGQRAEVVTRSHDLQQVYEEQRQQALSVLAEHFGDHPAGVAAGLVVLRQATIGADDPDAPPAVTAEQIDEAMGSLRGYVGPLCGE